MRMILSIVLIVATLSLRPAVAADSFIEIKLSGQVQNELRTEPLARTERLRRAVEVGNTLIRQVLDNSIFFFDMDPGNWSVKTEPLLAMKKIEFVQMVSDWNVAAHPALVCPTVELIELAELPQGEIRIGYQTIRIGAVVDSGNQFTRTANPTPYFVSFTPEKKRGGASALFYA